MAFTKLDSTSAAAIDGPYAWFRLVIALAISVFGAAGMWAIIVVLPAVQAEFGIDRADASIAYTATMVGFAFGNFLIGRAVDRLGIALPIMLAGVLLGGGFALAAISHHIVLLSLVQGTMIGFGASVTFAPLMSDMSHWFQRRRGIAMAIVAAGNYLGGAIWPFVISQLMAHDGWRLAYFVIGGLCLIAMVPLALFLRPRSPALQVSPGAPASSATTRQVDLSPAALQYLLVVAGIACCVAMSMPQVHIVALCADLGYGIAAGAGMLSLMTMGGIVSRLIAGFFADRFGGIQTLLISSVLQCLALMLFLPFDGLRSLYIVSLLFGLSQGGIVPSYAIIVREYLPAREAGQRIGMVIFATVAGMALGGWLSGWLKDLTGGYQAAFINGIAWNVLNIVIIMFIQWRTRLPALGRPQIA